MPSRLFFVRHGETDWNREGRLQGGQDVPLNPRGRDQAVAAGRTLGRLLAGAGLDPHGLDFVASPLGRARATMELMRAAMDLGPERYGLDDRLREIGFGVWEGMTWAEVASRDPEAHRARKRNKWGFAPTGGESYAAVVARLRPWLAALREDSVVVGHGGVARAMLTLLTSLDPRRAPEVEIAQGRVLVVAAGGAEWV